jgi:hypothetical protein
MPASKFDDKPDEISQIYPWLVLKAGDFVRIKYIFFFTSFAVKAELALPLRAKAMFHPKNRS